MDCFHKAEEKKLEKAEKYKEFCPTCNCYFNCVTDELVAKHLNSTKHKRNFNKTKNITDMSLMTIKELQAICNKSLNTSGTHLIPNFTRMKKAELIEKMNDNYSLLAFDLYLSIIFF